MSLRYQYEDGVDGQSQSLNGPTYHDVVIDIHIKHLKMSINELMNAPAEEEQIELPVRIVWTRGDRSAKTNYKKLSKNCDTAIFDEKFQITT